MVGRNSTAIEKRNVYTRLRISSFLAPTETVFSWSLHEFLCCCKWIFHTSWEPSIRHG